MLVCYVWFLSGHSTCPGRELKKHSTEGVKKIHEKAVCIMYLDLTNDLFNAL